MAEAIQISVSGLSEVKTTLNKFTKDLETNTGLNKELSSTIAQKASAIAPRLTGALASSIRGTATDKSAQITAGNNSVPYAGVIEYGWPNRNIDAQPYLTTAINESMGYIVEQYNDSIKDSIKKYNLN